MINKISRTACLLAAMIAVISVKPASAIFGFGDKKPQQPAATQESSSLPGMEGVSNNYNPSPNKGKSAAPSQTSPSTSAPAATSSANQQPPAPAATSSANPPAASAEGSQSAAAPPGGGALPSEVVIKGADTGQKVGVQKPPLSIETDPFESIRDSLAPDPSLLLAESPYVVTWRRTYPEFLSNSRVVQPWRTTFSERPGIVFKIQDQLQEAIGRPMDSKDLREFQWSLTIADEEGRVFQHYEGSKDPPKELIWTGQNDQGEWIRAGRSYSAVYTFTDAGGSPRTIVGKPVQFTGVLHQEPDAMHISLDSSVLFGATKAGQDLEKSGLGLLRSAADLIKRRFTGMPIRVQVYSSTRDLAETQANRVGEYLRGELMLMPQNVTIDPSHGSFSEQRVEILLLNR